MRRPPNRRRAVRPLARTVAYTRPQARAAPPSSGKGFQIEEDHCERCSRRPAIGAQCPQTDNERSEVDILHHERIEVSSKPLGIDSRCGRCRRPDERTRHKPAGGQGSQFGHRRPVAGNGHMVTRLYLTQDGRSIVAKLTLGNGAHRWPG